MKRTKLAGVASILEFRFVSVRHKNIRAASQGHEKRGTFSLIHKPASTQSESPIFYCLRSFRRNRVSSTLSATCWASGSSSGRETGITSVFGNTVSKNQVLRGTRNPILHSCQNTCTLITTVHELPICMSFLSSTQWNSNKILLKLRLIIFIFQLDSVAGGAAENTPTFSNEETRRRFPVFLIFSFFIILQQKEYKAFRKHLPYFKGNSKCFAWLQQLKSFFFFFF